ncbi:MAG: amidohydrolase family protein [Acidobacteria bacterium]|nr:amidohydrolase family protein [Acidobacteriota bacterium]
MKDLLKQKNIPVILRTPQALPGEEDEPYDINFTTPGVLHAAGVKVAMATFASGRAEVNSYNLTDQAGNTVAYGLPREEALKAITINPAQMYGVSDKLGTIEAGKIANIVVTNGDALELKTQIRYVFIRGVQTSLDSKFKQLYDKYRARP